MWMGLWRKGEINGGMMDIDSYFNGSNYTLDGYLDRYIEGWLSYVYSNRGKGIERKGKNR